MTIPLAILDLSPFGQGAFRSGARDEPYLTVSVDVLMAETDAEARRLAAGHARWVHSIRAADGAIPYPTPSSAFQRPLSAAELDVVRDRIATRYVDTPDAVAERLETLRRATGADELLVTTITHDPADREHSYELLARVWGLTRRGPAPATTVETEPAFA